MNEIVNIIVAATDLAEAEGRALRHAVVRTVLVSALVLAAVAVAVAGFGMLVFGSYLAFATILSNASAACVVGSILVMISGAGLWVSRHMLE